MIVDVVVHRLLHKHKLFHAQAKTLECLEEKKKTQKLAATPRAELSHGASSEVCLSRVHTRRRRRRPTKPRSNARATTRIQWSGWTSFIVDHSKRELFRSFRGEGVRFGGFCDENDDGHASSGWRGVGAFPSQRRDSFRASSNLRSSTFWSH